MWMEKLHHMVGFFTPLGHFFCTIWLKAAYEKIFAIIGATLKNGDAVSISGFGSFKVVQRKARKGRNPRTGEEMQIPSPVCRGFSC